MAITITWPTKVININKIDMTQVQVNPVPIYELDLNIFRLRLKDLEDDPEGITSPITHVHNPPLSVGGVELARTVEIINGYTVTFEDDQYAVNLVGANSNVGDRVNVNQVSVRSANSAGLVTSAAIEYGEYNGGVTIDVSNLTGKAITGISAPIGTLRVPSSRIADGISIANSLGFNKLFIIGNATFTSAHDIDNMMIIGDSNLKNTITVDAATSTVNTVFQNVEITGSLDGNNGLGDCIVNLIPSFSGHMYRCGLQNTITLSGSSASVLSNCYAIDPASPPTINMGGSGNDLSISDYSGQLTITNLTGISNFANIRLTSGTVTLNSTSVTNGTIQCTGNGELTDQSDVRITTGTWNTNVSVLNKTITEDSTVDRTWDELIANHTSVGSTGAGLAAASSGSVDYTALKNAVWDASDADHTTSGTMGANLTSIKDMVAFLKEIQCGEWKIEMNQMVLYDTATPTPNVIHRFALMDEDEQPTMENVRRRVPI